MSKAQRIKAVGAAEDSDPRPPEIPADALEVIPAGTHDGKDWVQINNGVNWYEQETPASWDRRHNIVNMPGTGSGGTAGNPSTTQPVTTPSTQLPAVTTTEPVQQAATSMSGGIGWLLLLAVLLYVLNEKNK